MFGVNLDDIKKATEKLEEFGEKLRAMIQPFLSDNITKKKSIELCQVGKFLILLDKESHIITHADSPDFTISYDGIKIGLEHQRILKSDKVEAIKSVSKLFDDTAELFKIEHPQYKVLVNCWLNTENFLFTKVEINLLKKEISDYIFGIITKNSPLTKPSFIEEVFITEHTDVAFEYNPGGYLVNTIDIDSLKRAIAKKEALVTNYKDNSKTQRQWLLLVIGSASPDSFKLGNSKLKVNTTSSFERIYIMEDFDAKLLRLL